MIVTYDGTFWFSPLLYLEARLPLCTVRPREKKTGIILRQRD